MKSKLLLIILELFFSVLISHAQINNRWKDVGIPIDKKSFNILTKKELILMQRNKTIHMKDIINIIRIDNTVKMNGLVETNQVYYDFEILLHNKYTKIFVNELNATWSQGAAFYVKKYNIYWGGIPHNNSIFKIK